MANPQPLEDAWVNTNFDKTKWIRIDPETGGLYRYNSESGGFDIALPIALDAVTDLVDSLASKSDSSHTHEHLDELADIVTLLTGGVTGSKTIQGYTLTFNHGVLTGFQAP